jgi:integrase
LAKITSDRGCQAAKTNPDGSRRDYAIAASPGLQLRVTGGAKRWSLVYRRPSDSKQVRTVLGEYPAMGIAEARIMASDYRNRVTRDEDPMAQKLVHQRALTFEKLAQRWLDRYAKARRKSWAESERILKKDVLPMLGATKAEAVTKKDVLACADAILERGAPVLANRVLTLIGSIYAWGASEDLVEKNPTLGARKRAVEVSRERKLSAEEIRRFWHGLDDAKMHRETSDILRLCLLLGQRVNEIAQAPKAEFDLVAGVWEIAASRVKNKKQHRLPLPPAAVAILKAAFERAPHSALAFPSPAKVDDVMVTKGAVTKAWIRSRKALGIDDVTVHDLRRTFASLAGDLEFDDFAIGLVLNHSGARSKVTSIYNRAQYDENKRRVLEAVERRLFDIIEQREPVANVVTLRARNGQGTG